MSRAAHVANLRSKKKMGTLKITSENFEDIKLEDSMMTDGLMCALTGQHMGNTAENIAKKFQISRQAQDDFAFASVQKVSGPTRPIIRTISNPDSKIFFRRFRRKKKETLKLR